MDILTNAVNSGEDGSRREFGELPIEVWWSENRGEVAKFANNVSVASGYFSAGVWVYKQSHAVFVFTALGLVLQLLHPLLQMNKSVRHCM